MERAVEYEYAVDGAAVVVDGATSPKAVTD